MEVLFATDGESPGHKAARLLDKIGNRERMNVTVFSVVSFALALEQGAATTGHYSVEAGQRYVAAAVERTVAGLRAAGFTAGGRIEAGDPALEIVSAMGTNGYDVALLGSGSASWLGQLVLGSVANKVLQGISSSVVIVHRLLTDHGGKVLVGADGSDGSEAALGVLEDFADPRRTKVSVMSVAAPGASENLVRLDISEASRTPERVGQVVLSEARSHSEMAAERLRKAGFDVDTIVPEGSPGDLLLREADSGRFDMIAVGARGRGPFPHSILGSVSDKVARRAATALIGRSR
jgi:nucleotide-binding universal stress UspA family protein